ncbi:MAG TPA: hypothetical protein DCY03_14175 [Planctomycetaceae bacterium]|nr:hypothetical protein [Planctomycetaceae bacterium]
MTKKNLKLVDKLNDTCFVYASESMSELCRMIEGEAGEKPTLSDLCDVLTASIRCCPDDLLQDVNVQAIETLTAKVKSRKKIVAEPSDVFAVPRNKGGYYFVVYITSNRFGEAFGVLQDYGRIARMPSDPPMP